jgi:hypothetical protein
MTDGKDGRAVKHEVSDCIGPVIRVSRKRDDCLPAVTGRDCFVRAKRTIWADT